MSLKVGKGRALFRTLGTILKDNWEWRKQINRLAIFELMKEARGAVLGWAWLAIKPIVFIAVFWFTLAVGLKAGGSLDGSYPYFIWLLAGLIPWFYMSDMLSSGSDVLHRYSYLVTKMKFPQSGISTLYSISTLIVNAVLFVIMFVFYGCYGMKWDIYLLQVPLLLLLMFVFFNLVSIVNSQLSGISKDFGQLMKALTQPLFWLSGVLFSMSSLATSHFAWAAKVMLFNPVTFFCTAFRDALCDKIWFWQDPVFLGCFLLMLIVTLVAMPLVYRRFHEEVCDVL